jgi:hypothetical protein
VIVGCGRTPPPGAVETREAAGLIEFVDLNKPDTAVVSGSVIQKTLMGLQVHLKVRLGKESTGYSLDNITGTSEIWPSSGVHDREIGSRNRDHGEVQLHRMNMTFVGRDPYVGSCDRLVSVPLQKHIVPSRALLCGNEAGDWRFTLRSETVHIRAVGDGSARPLGDVPSCFRFERSHHDSIRDVGKA